ncbi:Small integral membrane protein 20 [Portunus trituberculatus]|uniref:Small integral membrane protein 20 n=1 Tax=Portunus trituberculatus TaxID=210409 RepID=A0A5B7F062_PORTR|nr:Small integral membrane protein 20 [Portunus trituberculatus]
MHGCKHCFVYVEQQCQRYTSGSIHYTTAPPRDTNYEELHIMTILRGWRYNLFVGALVGFIGATLYPIAIYPMMNSGQYKQAQIENRKGINQEEIQPGNMKVWSDPFDRKK